MSTTRKIMRLNGKKYDPEDGGRLTDCCGSYSTFDEYGDLYCKKCYQGVEMGEGDGSEAAPGFTSAAERVQQWMQERKAAQ